MPVSRERLKQEKDVLKLALEDDGSIADQLQEILDDDICEGVKLEGKRRDRFMTTVGYLVGVSEERGLTISELFESEDLS